MLVCDSCGNCGCFETLDFIRYVCCTCGNVVEFSEPLRRGSDALKGGQDVSP